MADYYPNECCICRARNNLKRCSRCNMISYCGKEHQIEHLLEHKDVCNVISSILKEKKISHVYENKINIDALGWKKAKLEIVPEIFKRLGRYLEDFEKQMFLFPRVCCVCYDSRQELLKSCPRCPNASFCEKHPESSIHDEDCPEIQEGHKIYLGFQKLKETLDFEVFNKSLIQNTPFIKSKTKILLTSMRDYLTLIEDKIKMDNILKMYVADYASSSLTIFDVLQKLKISSPLPSKLDIHIYGAGYVLSGLEAWEILLHLVPTLNLLNVVIFECKSMRKMRWTLCDKCRAVKKKLTVTTISIPYLDFMKMKTYENPGLVLFMNTNPPTKDKEMYQRVWKLCVNTLALLNCPLVILSNSEGRAQIIKESINDSFKNVRIFYEGQNNFVSGRPIRDWECDRICRENDNMIVFKVLLVPEIQKCNRCRITCRTVNPKTVNCARCESELLCRDAALFPKQSDNQFRTLFYLNCCQVCQSSPDPLSNNTMIACQKCRMIFYCDKDHQKEHWPQHRDLCKVICSMTDELGSFNLFQKVDKSNNQSWFKSKVDLFLKAQAKLNRKLLEYEREMFLFPRTCFVCHKDDSVPLGTCKCAISLCIEHADADEHTKRCDEQYFTLKCTTQFLEIRKSPAPVSTMEMVLFFTRKDIFEKIPLMKNEGENLPESMGIFIQTYIEFSNADIWKVNNPDKLSNTREMICAELFSRPLTLFSAFKIFDWPLDSMVVHVIGATDDEKSEAGYWEIMLHFVPRLKNLKIIFVGPEVSVFQSIEVDLCECCMKEKQNLKVEAFSLRYDEYFKNESFRCPDFIVGFNLHIHESDYGIIEETWKDTILTLAKIPAPFLMTAATYAKAQMGAKKLEEFFQHSAKYDSLEINEFRVGAPRRDFETEQYEVQNQFIVTYHRSLGLLNSPGSEEVGMKFDYDLELREKVKNWDINAQALQYSNSELRNRNSESEPKPENSKAITNDRPKLKKEKCD